MKHCAGSTRSAACCDWHTLLRQKRADAHDGDDRCDQKPSQMTRNLFAGTRSTPLCVLEAAEGCVYHYDIGGAFQGMFAKTLHGDHMSLVEDSSVTHEQIQLLGHLDRAAPPLDIVRKTISVAKLLVPQAPISYIQFSGHLRLLYAFSFAFGGQR